MVRQTTVAGPITRAMGVRLHTEMGEAGEEIVAVLSGGRVLGRGTFRGWPKAPPIDVLDEQRGIGYQVKVLTDPLHKVSFSGAHKNIHSGKRIGGRPQYIGTPEDKLEDIQAWLAKSGWEGILVVIVLDEDANRATVHATRGVVNVSIRDMVPVGIIDNDAGVFHVPRLLEGGLEEVGLDWWPKRANIPSLPNIPEFLRSSTSGEVAPEIAGVRPLFRRPVQVRAYRRRH